MARLPIRALTLYKQGIGYFQRRGTVTDSQGKTRFDGVITKHFDRIQ